MEDQWKSVPSKSGQQDVCYGKWVSLNRIPNFVDSNHNPPHGIFLPFTKVQIHHDTDLPKLLTILSDGFKGDTYEENVALSWWSLTLPALDTSDLLRIASLEGKPSPVLKVSESRYGNYRLNIQLQHLVEYYKSCMKCADVDFRIFGTFTEKQEVTYSVVVHPKGGEGDEPAIKELEKLPLVPFLDRNKQTMAEDMKKTGTQMINMSDHLPTDSSDQLNDMICDIEKTLIGLRTLASPIYTFADSDGVNKLSWDIKSILSFSNKSQTDCLFDNVAFAFYLPRGQHIRISHKTFCNGLQVMSSSDEWLSDTDGYPTVQDALKQLNGSLRQRKEFNTHNCFQELIARMKTDYGV